MLVLNYKQFLDKLKKNKAQAIIFYDGHSPVREEGNVRDHFDKIVSDSTEKFLDEVKQFAKMYPAQFTAYAFTTDKAITKNGDLLHVDLYQASTNTPQAPVQQINEEALIKRVTKEITDKAEANLVAERLKLAESKLALMENATERIATLGMALVEKFFEGSPATMQGTEGSTEEGEDISIEDAIQMLRESFGDKTLIILAKKIKADPDLPAMMKIKLGL